MFKLEIYWWNILVQYYFIFGTQALTCKEIFDISRTSTAEVRISNIQAVLVEECLANLGKQRLDKTQAEEIWRILVTEYGDPGSVPDETLKMLGWVSIGIPPQHYLNMTLEDIDVISTFGEFHDLSKEQLTALSECVRENWGGKTPEDYSHFDLQALGHIICAFNKSDIEKIHAKAYKYAAAELSNLHKCPQEVLEGLANIAMDPAAFGHPSRWTKVQVATIGTVLSGLSPVNYNSIPKYSLSDVRNN